MEPARAASQILGLTLHERYRVLEPISRGAMGAVYRGLDNESGEEVAIKQSLEDSSQRFEIEARLLASLRHPRIPAILDHFEEPLGRFLVMELVEGIDLRAVIKQQGDPGLPLQEAVGYVLQACDALQYVHDQQIVHRDVKPANIILSADGISLVDFGIARQLDEEEVSGTVGIGTARFMAPEVFAGGTISARTDVFGISATLWNLLTGRAPVYAEPTALSTLVPDIPPEVEATIRAGLEIVPERRLASARALAGALGAPFRETSGESLALSIDDPKAPSSLMEAIVRTAAGVFNAVCASVALVDPITRELVYQSAWGAGAREIVGVRLPPGKGLSGHVVMTGVGEAVACRTDPRFAAAIAAGTGYVPYTMVIVPLQRGSRNVGALSILDKRDGSNFGPEDVERARLFAELAVKAIDVSPGAFTSLGPSTALGQH